MDLGNREPPAFGGSKVCFFTLIARDQQEPRARLAVDSLRRFGGPLANSPVLVFYPNLSSASETAWRDLDQVDLLPLTGIRAPRYWFSTKVHAGARAEELGSGHVRTLVWLAPESLIVQPPSLFDLARSRTSAAFRTVHHANVGSPADQPADAFWSKIYRSIGLAQARYTTRSFVDGRELRPYWNTHCFAVDPRLGVLQSWRERFCALVEDASFQAGACKGVPHQVFLHQAVLCALLTKQLGQRQIRALPPEYSYPLHMHDQVPEAYRAVILNELVCAVYEEVLPLAGLTVQEPLRSWLQDRLG